MGTVFADFAMSTREGDGLVRPAPGKGDLAAQIVTSNNL
jgi:hypothetical protein